MLYEIGYIDPKLIAEYVQIFLQLLHSKNNRLVGGAMIALSTIAPLVAEQLAPHIDTIKRLVQNGSVITVDAGIQTLAGIAAAGENNRRKIVPFLLQHLSECRPKDVAQHAEKIVTAIDANTNHQFISLLERRRADLTETQWRRVSRVQQLAATRK